MKQIAKSKTWAADRCITAATLPDSSPNSLKRANASHPPYPILDYQGKILCPAPELARQQYSECLAVLESQVKSARPECLSARAISKIATMALTVLVVWAAYFWVVSQVKQSGCALMKSYAGKLFTELQDGGGE